MRNRSLLGSSHSRLRGLPADTSQRKRAARNFPSPHVSAKSPATAPAAPAIAATLGMPLVLASASPRRRDLLTEAGYAFEVEPAQVEEKAPAHLTVREVVLFNAKLKAEDVARRRSASALILGADTLVAFRGQPLGKPRDLDEAFEMLSRLSGQTHEVFSGLWLVQRSACLSRGFTEVSQVRFRALSTDEIRTYMRRINPLDKAGAYAAQEDPMRIIAEIRGSKTNVIGLPMRRLREQLSMICHPGFVPCSAAPPAGS